MPQPRNPLLKLTLACLLGMATLLQAGLSHAEEDEDNEPPPTNEIRWFVQKTAMEGTKRVPADRKLTMKLA